MFLFIFLCVIIGPIMGNPSAEKELLESAEKAIASYSKIIDDLIPKLKYPEAELFPSYRYYYSAATGQNVGELKTTLLDGDTNFFNAKQSIYNLCGESIETLEAYKSLLDDQNDESAAARKYLLSEVLDSEIQYLQEGDNNIKQTSANLNTSLSKLGDLITQLQSDHLEEGEYFKSFVSAAKLEAAANRSSLEIIANATLAAVKELNRFGVSDPIVNKFLEMNQLTLPPPEDITGRFTIKLKAKFAEVEKFYENLKFKVTETVKHLDSTAAKLKEDAKQVKNSKTQAENLTSVKLPADVVRATKNVVNYFITKCKSYRAANGAPKE